MHGTIDFNSLEELAEFLGFFTGKSTALFEAREIVTDSRRFWRLEFTGGY